MLTNNPFAEMSALISPTVMQGYVVLMIALVVGGTVLDMIHKQSAKYFFENSRKAQKDAKVKVGGIQKTGLAVKTVANEVLTSSEFCNKRRRLSHLMTMYGFIFFVVTTALLIFKYTGSEATAPALIPLLWHLGALSLCVGGYWFWFAIRVDVASEGVKWHQFNGRGDLFILGLLFTATFALLWSISQAAGAGTLTVILFALFILSSTVLFGSVYWSKFAHMFFKPAAALQKRIAEADGSMDNMPPPADAPEQFGLGIKRELPRHY